MPSADGRISVLKKPDVTDLAGEKVMIDFDSGNYFLLKGAAGDIWDGLADGVTPEDIVQKLLAIYEVDEAECRESTLSFLEQLQKIGFIAID